jgi:hypothetical protein
MRTSTDPRWMPSGLPEPAVPEARYDRRLSDRAVAGQETSIDLRVRRFFCDNAGCGKRTFAEQIPGPTIRHGRRAASLGDDLRAIALGGRQGSRLAGSGPWVLSAALRQRLTPRAGA